MSGYKEMEKFLKNAEFIDYISHEKRVHDIAVYDRRIKALQDAKEVLESTTVRKLEKKERKNAKALCDANGWSEEEAMLFVEIFKKKKPRKKANPSFSELMNSMSKIGDVFIL